MWTTETTFGLGLERMLVVARGRRTTMTTTTMVATPHAPVEGPVEAEGVAEVTVDVEESGKGQATLSACCPGEWGGAPTRCG